MNQKIQDSLRCARLPFLHLAIVACTVAGTALGAHAADELTSAAANATYKTDKAACDSLAGNAKDICVEQAKAKHEVALAESQYQANATEKNRLEVQKARINGDYAVAVERCDDKSGNVKDVCREEAKAAKSKAMAELKATEKNSSVRSDTQHAKAEADYKVARERCDSLSGDAKDACVKEAQARFGKS